jgi:hypothetical protein
MKHVQVSHSLFGVRDQQIGEFTMRVLEAIKDKWPTNPLEVAERFNDEGNMKALSARYLYHFRKLKKMDLIDMKKIGNTYIAWPIEMEKLRVVHDLLKGV